MQGWSELLTKPDSAPEAAQLQSSLLSWRWTRSWSVVGKVSHFDLWLLSIWQLMALQQIGSNIRSSDMTREGRFNNMAGVVMPAKSFHNPSQQVPPSPDGQKHFVSLSFVRFQDFCFNLCCSSRWSRAQKLQMIQCSENQMWQESFVVFLKENGFSCKRCSLTAHCTLSANDKTTHFAKKNCTKGRRKVQLWRLKTLHRPTWW